MKRLKAFFSFLYWLCIDEPKYCHICSHCGFIHYDKSEECCLCTNTTIKVSEGRAQEWRADIRRNTLIAGMQEA